MVIGLRVADRIGVLAKMFTPAVMDRVIDKAGVRDQGKRALPARVVVCCLLASASAGLGRCWGRLLVTDRNFLSQGCSPRSDIDLPVLEVLSDGTYRSRIADPAGSQRRRRQGAAPTTFPASTCG